MYEAGYRAAERRLWDSVDLRPSERRIRLATTQTNVRVQQVGTGDPVVFLHGCPNAGSTWAPMIAHIKGFQCLVVDRPGTCLSAPFMLTADNLADVGAAFVGDLLDGLEIDQAHVIASSFGGHLALRSAASHPERIQRMVQLGAPALIPGQQAPPFIKLMRCGVVRRLLNVLPPSDRATRSILRQIGHGASLDRGTMPQPFLEWYRDLARYTNTMRNDGEMIGQLLVRNKTALTLTEELLASVEVPTLLLWGDDDGFGGIADARKVAGLLPEAELVMLPSAGHLPWLDQPERTAHLATAYLADHAPTKPTTEPAGARDRITGGRR